METALPGEGIDNNREPVSKKEAATDAPATAKERAGAYWKENLKLLARLLSVWFVVSFGAGILAVDWLNQFNIGGVKLGFWFAQQGSIYVFVALIFVYTYQMKRLEKRFGVDD